jgi:hypothetical protein
VEGLIGARAGVQGLGTESKWSCRLNRGAGLALAVGGGVDSMSSRPLFLEIICANVLKAIVLVAPTPLLELLLA